MLITHHKIILLAATLALSACAQNPQVASLQQQVGQLNQKLQNLTMQTSLSEHQNALNRNSGSGAYLLPGSHDGAQLDSDIGLLNISLSNLNSEANGSQALLHIRSGSAAPLTPFTATIDWGQLDAATGRPLEQSVLSQPITVGDSLLPKTEQTLELRFSGLPPESLGFVRVHHVTAVKPVVPAVGTLTP